MGRPVARIDGAHRPGAAGCAALSAALLGGGLDNCAVGLHLNRITCSRPDDPNLRPPLGAKAGRWRLEPYGVAANEASSTVGHFKNPYERGLPIDREHIVVQHFKSLNSAVS